MKKMMLILVSLMGFQAWSNGLEGELASKANLRDYVEAVRMGSSSCTMESVKIDSVSYKVPELENHSIWDLAPLIYSMKLENSKGGHLMTFFGNGIDSAAERYVGEKLYFKLYSNFDFFNSFEIEVYTDDSKSQVINIIVKTYKIVAANAGTLLAPQLLNKSQQYILIGYKCN